MTSPTDSVRITRSPFGTLPDGTPTELFTLETEELIVRLTTFGARIVSLETKDRNGVFADITLGYNDAATYATTTNAYLGATIGRFGNRIAGGRFSIGGKTFQVPQNDGPNALHGGPVGFDLRNWQAEELPNGVSFTLTSEDGDQGFPGTLTTTATYLVSGNQIRHRYEARADKATIVNLTNHAYFNLDGEGAKTILDHEVTLAADSFTPTNEALIPTGELRPVSGTPFDFKTPRRIGERIGESDEQLVRARGYDHNFVVRGEAGVLRPAASVFSPASGRILEVATTEPGIQFYSGNFLDGTLMGKSGKPYVFRCGLCLETQHFPDSPNHPEFPSTELQPGETYTSETVWTFSHK